jgi:hypothetical protein
LVYGKQWLRFKWKFREQSATVPDLLADWTLPSKRNHHKIILGMELETANEGKTAIHIALLWPVLLKMVSMYIMALEPLQKIVFAEISL